MALFDSKQDMLAANDERWRNFVNDHLEVIREQSEEVVVTMELISKYAHRMDAYYLSQGLSNTVLWIVHYLNKTSFYKTPSPGSVLYVPSMSTITDLYRRYQTNR